MGTIFESALTVQRSFMEVYGESLEQMLNLLVYMVPVEDDEGDTAGFYSQSVFAITDLFGLYRTVLLRSPEALPVVAPADASSSSSWAAAAAAIRQPHGLQRARITYTVSAFTLRALRSVQVLIEMRAQRMHGVQHALQVCLRVEVVKLALKMVLRKCMPFSFYVDEDALEEVEPPKASRQRSLMLPSPEDPAAGAQAPAISVPAYVGARSGKILPAMGATRLLKRIDCTAASFGGAVGELLFHCRPLVHLMLLLRRGRKSWVAWFTALALDYASLTMLAPRSRPRPNSRAASLEVAEMRRRRNLLWWAFVRSPMFELLLRRPCEVLDGILSRIPIINVFRIMELFLALQPFYFTTSAS